MYKLILARLIIGLALSLTGLVASAARVTYDFVIDFPTFPATGFESLKAFIAANGLTKMTGTVSWDADIALANTCAGTIQCNPGPNPSGGSFVATSNLDGYFDVRPNSIRTFVEPLMAPRNVNEWQPFHADYRNSADRVILSPRFNTQGSVWIDESRWPYLRVGPTGTPSIVFTLRGPNTAPTANAGVDQSIREGNNVNLNGGASFDDNTASTALGYAWSFVSVPAGSTASLASATTATPSFVADKAGTYVVGLVVTDEGGLASPQSQVVISSANRAPTADAGADQMVVVFSTVSLNGSGSTDPEGDTLTYAWTIAGPTGSTAPLNGANTATPNFQPDVPGTYVMTLTASDFLGAGMPDTVEVTAITAAAYAELQIMGAANLIAGLGPNQVTTKGNQNALGNFLSQALKAVQRGDIATAIFKINEAIERTNGCEVNPGPSPDGNGAGRDWVTDCDMQLPILAQLRSARDALTP